MELITQLVQEYTSLPDVEVARMFGSDALKVNGKVFFIVMKDGIVFKLPVEAMPQALEIKGADYFDAHKNGKKMKDWVFIPSEAVSDNCAAIAQTAYEYLGGQGAK